MLRVWAFASFPLLLLQRRSLTHSPSIMPDHAVERGKQAEGIVIHKFKGNDSLVLDTTKSGDLKFPRVDVNRRHTLGYEGESSCAAAAVDPNSFSTQLGETPKVDLKKVEVGESSTMRRNVELFNNEAKFSGKLTAQQLTESYIKWKNSKSYACHSLDIYRSEFEHFPMFDINRKIEAIMTSNKKYSYGAVSAKMKEESLSLHENVMMPNEDLFPDNTDDIGGAASRFFQINDKLLTAGTSDTDSNSRYFGSSWANLKEGSTHMLRESSPSYYTYTSSDRNDGEEKGDSSNRIFLGQKRPRKPDGSDMHHWHFKIPQRSMHDVNRPEPYKKFKPVESGEQFHMLHRTPTMGDYASTQDKEITFSERRIMPFVQKHGNKEISAASFGNFTSDDVRNERDGFGVLLMGASNESSTRTDTLYNHTSYRSSSLLGETISSAPKGASSSKLRTESSSASPVAVEQAALRNPATVITMRRALADDEAGVPQTETMPLDHKVSLAIADNAYGSETCSRWVQRLQQNHSRTLSLCTKRFKQGHVSSTEHCSDYSEKSVQSWIRRWSHNCPEISPVVSRPVEQAAVQEESSKELPEKVEGKLLGSFGAMALMGKAMKDYRPCNFRRKQASLVWNA